MAQVNEAIQQLDKVTQQNAGASEQVAVTSESLSQQAGQLQATIGYFKVDNVKKIDTAKSVQVDSNVAQLRVKAAAMRATEADQEPKRKPAPIARPKKVANGGFSPLDG